MAENQDGAFVIVEVGADRASTPSQALGWMDVIAKSCSLEEALAPTEVDGLVRLPRGAERTTPSSPAIDDGVAELLRQLRRQFSYVIVDGPPLFVRAELLRWIPHVDGVALVVEANRTRRETLDPNVKFLSESSSLLGVVLNKRQTLHSGLVVPPALRPLMYANRYSARVVGIALLMSLLAASTSGQTTEPGAAVAIPADLAQPSSFPEYTIMPDDALDIIYNLEYGYSSEDYVLDVLDEIEINALHHQELSGRYRIRTDGKITLPYKGSMHIIGITVDELIARLETEYSDIFRSPEIFVKLTEFGAKVEELKRIISSDRRGQIFETRVRPDGVISLPIIGDMGAAGMTLPELTEAVRLAYQPTYKEIGISIILSDSPGSVFYVLGQVDRPGQYPMSVPTTVSQALALSGVSTTTAGLKNVIVVSMANPGRPVGSVLNLEPILKGEVPEDDDEFVGDRLLSRYDVVFVPKTRIAKVNQFVNQYISNLVLFNGWSVVFGQRFQQ